MNQAFYAWVAGQILVDAVVFVVLNREENSRRCCNQCSAFCEQHSVLSPEVRHEPSFAIGFEDASSDLIDTSEVIRRLF